jgi:hypothetical protein
MCTRLSGPSPQIQCRDFSYLASLLLPVQLFVNVSASTCLAFSPLTIVVEPFRLILAWHRGLPVLPSQPYLVDAMYPLQRHPGTVLHWLNQHSCPYENVAFGDRLIGNARIGLIPRSVISRNAQEE